MHFWRETCDLEKGRIGSTLCGSHIKQRKKTFRANEFSFHLGLSGGIR